MDINEFVSRVPNFYDLSSADKIDYLVYYLLIIGKQKGVKPKEIESCFNQLHTFPYSNISAYLGRLSKKGSTQKFIRGSYGYLLERRRKEAIDKEIKSVSTPKPSDALFPMSLLDGTRGYLLQIGQQACICYDLGLYDASLVMLRKLIEILIIECFERYGIPDKIKGTDGHFCFLSKLIDKFLVEKGWSLGRNTMNALPKIKKLGDLSAHNRRYSAKKSDIDRVDMDFRIVIEDLVNLIDYPNWKKEQ